MSFSRSVTAGQLGLLLSAVLLATAATDGASAQTSAAPDSLRAAASVRPSVAPSGSAVSGSKSAAASLAIAGTPNLRVQVVVTGLDIPWDVAVLPDRSWLITERERKRLLLRTPTGAIRVIADTPSGFWSSGETGLMSVAADPEFAANSRFYTCNGFYAGDHPEIRVVAWRLNATHTDATRLGPLLTGIDINSGRHGGCRLRFGPSGALYVGTGDAAVGTNPQDLHSLNGKVLRLNRFTGAPWPSNPWPFAKNAHKRYICTYGHRNVQGLAYRPNDRMWSVEHGTDRNDEVNRLLPGANYGWNPVPGYDESTPMTDFSLPGKQQAARWRSGYPTVATSGARWVQGAQWGAYEGALAVCALKASKLLFMRFDSGGHLLWLRAPGRLDGTYGRLRSVTQTSSGALLLTTSNGGGADKILRVTPR